MIVRRILIIHLPFLSQKIPMILRNSAKAGRWFATIPSLNFFYWSLFDPDNNDTILAISRGRVPTIKSWKQGWKL
jgi:hypothetical protein